MGHDSWMPADMVMQLVYGTLVIPLGRVLVRVKYLKLVPYLSEPTLSAKWVQESAYLASRTIKF